jgi:PAS domain S-box-containing protein
MGSERLAEKHFRVIIDKSPDGMIIVDQKGNVCFVNPSAESLFDRPKEKFMGESFGFPTIPDASTEIRR